MRIELTEEESIERSKINLSHYQTPREDLQSKNYLHMLEPFGRIKLQESEILTIG
jgi:hypothetical protein